MGSEEKEYVLVSEYFHPDTASTGQLMTDLAVGLQNRGLEMTVYTGQPNYHSGENERQPRESTYKGVTIRRVRAPQVRQSSMLRRGFNWVIFTIWMFCRLLLSTPDQEREVIFVSNPPFLPLAMWFVCRLRGWEYTYIVYDLYPDFLVENGDILRNGVADTVWTWLNQHVFGAAKHIVALGPAMRDRIGNSVNDTDIRSKITIIHNWADGEFIQPMAKEENWFSQKYELTDQFTVVYSGNIGQNHDLETIIRAAPRLKDEPVQFLIIGGGDRKADIVSLAKELGVAGDTVRFLPYQPLEDLSYSLTAGDVSIVSVQSGMRGICVSSKLYTSLAAGQPILLVSSPDDDEARILKSFDSGSRVSPGMHTDVVDAVHQWLANPDLVDTQGRNARDAFETYFTKTRSLDRYYKVLADGEQVQPDPVSHSSHQ